MIIDLLQIIYNPPEDKTFVEQYSGTLGTLSVIAIFIIERLFARRERRQERRLNWYYSVIILPHVPSINNIFTTFSNLSTEIFNDLIKYNGQPQHIINNAKAVHFRRLKTVIQDFEFEYLLLIYTFSLVQYNNLAVILAEMREEVIKVLDFIPLTKEHQESLADIIRNKKQLYFDQLYLQTVQ